VNLTGEPVAEGEADDIEVVHESFSCRVTAAYYAASKYRTRSYQTRKGEEVYALIPETVSIYGNMNPCEQEKAFEVRLLFLHKTIRCRMAVALGLLDSKGRADASLVRPTVRGVNGDPSRRLYPAELGEYVATLGELGVVSQKGFVGNYEPCMELCASLAETEGRDPVKAADEYRRYRMAAAVEVIVVHYFMAHRLTGKIVEASKLAHDIAETREIASTYF